MDFIEQSETTVKLQTLKKTYRHQKMLVHQNTQNL